MVLTRPSASLECVSQATEKCIHQWDDGFVFIDYLTSLLVFEARPGLVLFEADPRAFPTTGSL